jgi:molybdate transport system substrate-binding protein
MPTVLSTAPIPAQSGAGASACPPHKPHGLLALAAALSLLIAGVSCSTVPTPPRTLSIAAASDLKFALDDLAKLFQKSYPGVQISPTYGSSGNFYAQIRSGAPFDLFLSADAAYPRRLLEEKIGAPGSIFLYATGSIVVWTRADSPLDPQTALRSAHLHKLAIANPEHAPYGAAAVAALRSLGLYESLRPKLVLGENVAQALAFAESGAAEACIVARSLAVAPAAAPMGRYWEVPPSAYPPISQAGLIVKDSAPARAFREYLLSPEARAVILRMGFSAPERR